MNAIPLHTPALLLLLLVGVACQAPPPASHEPVHPRGPDDAIVVQGAHLPLPMGLGRIEAEEIRLPAGPGTALSLRTVRAELDPAAFPSIVSRSDSATETTTTTLAPSSLRPNLDALYRGSIDGLVVSLGAADDAQQWTFHSMSWKLTPDLSEQPGLRIEAELFPRPYDSWKLTATITPTAAGFQLDDGRLQRGAHSLEFRASLTLLDAGTFLDLSFAPLPCETLLALAPASWKAPFSNLQVAGTVAPWIEIGVRGGIRDVRVGGFATDERRCEVTSLAWNAPRSTPLARATTANALRNTDVTFLNGPFSLPVVEGLPPRTSVHVGPSRPGYVALDDLPAHVEAAFYLSEETEFYGNAALSHSVLSHAMTRNLQELRLAAGGSTITQQLTKNLFLTRERTLERKFQEAILATRIAQVVSRERILELYINCIELGPGIYGVEAAAHHYFQKTARDLTASEAAFLAAITPYPYLGERARDAGDVALVPGLDSSVRAILGQMHRAGYILETHPPLQFTGAI